MSGHDITLLGRVPHLEAIDKCGLRIDGIWGEHRASGFEVASNTRLLRGYFDAVLICVKSYDTAAMAASIAPFVAPDGLVVSLQNGLGNVEAIQEKIDPQRILAARVIFGATITAPGAVRVTVYAEPVLVGAWESKAPTHLCDAARAWAGEFNRSGIVAEYCAEIRAALWGKVFYNAALNPLGALLGVHYGALGENADSRVIMDTVINEAFAVACAEGVNLPWASADAYRALFYEKLVPATFHHRSSMLQDLERGRRTEVDAINGQIWSRGSKHGIPTPANELLSRLMQAQPIGPKRTGSTERKGRE